MTPSTPSFEFTISSMKVRDLPRVAEIERMHQREPWSEAAFGEELAKPHALCRVARPSNGGCERGVRGMAHGAGFVLGYACAWIVLDEIQVLNVTVDRVFWRRGIGRALLGRVLDEGRIRGATRATLEVRPSNAEALGLYGSLGFRRVGERPGFYTSDKEAAIVMDLDLKTSGKPL
ncbi:MAG: GNAT family N-acetyltransferase [Syntrophobacteraceae bacterium]|jgi:ribosomal-protein-alanine N-acetyltransferase|nr:GNAT family N-acetyltransferase [Syntrophobacteraceae bacterium]MCU0588756.1 GNAT family N-acetyltransferase [Syntrophobacteraceae bacterium]